MSGGRIKGITLEIDGSTTGLDKALKGTETNLSSVQRSLKDVNRLLKMDPTNTELLTQKQNLLSQAIQETKQKLEILKEADAQAKEQLDSGDMGQDKYDALQREIIDTEQKLKDLEKQAKSSSSILGTQMQEAGKKISDVGEKITDAGKKLLPASTAIAGIGVASVKTASDFESSMSQVQATMGLTKDSMSSVDGQTVNTMDTLSQLAKKMGEETAFSASECAEALNYLALAGYDTQQMVDTLPTVLNLASAGGMDLATASDMVTDAMSAMGMETSQADMMVDQMAKTTSSTNTSVAQLGEGILTIGAITKSIKGGTAELNTALGILANNGIKGAEGGTHLRNVILSLQNPTDTAAGCLEKLGVSVYDSEGNMRSLNDILGDLNKSMDGMTSEEKSNIIGNIFNKTDLSSVNALLANTGETWDSLQESITNSAGAAQQMADTQLDNLNGQITILKSAIEGAAISIGEVLVPIIKEVVEKIQEWTDKFNSLDDNQKKTIVTIAAIVAAIGPVLVIIGTVISTVGKVTSAIGLLMSSGLLPIIAIIAAVVAAGVLLYKNWDTIKKKAGDLKENVTNKFNELKTGALEKIDSLKSGAINKFQDIKTGITDKINGARDSVKQAIEKIKGFFNFSWSLPKLKLPHISISGKFSLSPPSVPKFGISWYKKAMDNAYLLNGASIFGSMNGNLLGGGEDGSEMIMGKQYMIDMIQQASAKNNEDIIKAMNYMGNQMIGIMSKYLPECAKQKIAIPERTLSRSLRDMGVAFE